MCRFNQLIGLLYILSALTVYITIYYEYGPYSLDILPYKSLVIDTRSTQIRDYEPWRWYSYSLVHLNENHLWGNVIGTAFFGIFLVILNDYFDFWKIPLIHTVSIIQGGLAINGQYVVQRLTMVTLGASGGVYGLYAACLPPLFMCDLTFEKRILYGAAILTSTITSCVSVKYNPPTVSYAGHVGGYVGGLLASIAMIPNPNSTSWIKNLQIASCFSLLALVCTGIGMSIAV